MNSDEWFALNVLIPTLGGMSQFIQSVDPSVLDTARKRPTFSTLSSDVVCHILSFTLLSDTRNVRSVCSQWAAQTRKQLFWIPRIKAAKASFVGEADVITAISLFDTFNSPIKEALRDQVEWLFRKEWLRVELHSSKDLIVCRKTNHNTAYEEWIRNGNLVERTWFESSSPDRYEGKLISVLTLGRLRRVEQDDINKAYVRYLVMHFENGDIYEGEGLYETAKWYAHGTGKWIFADGHVLEGEMVACRDEPRYKKRRI
jgi:hypothetical protein